VVVFLVAQVINAVVLFNLSGQISILKEDRDQAEGELTALHSVVDTLNSTTVFLANQSLSAGEQLQELTGQQETAERQLTELEDQLSNTATGYDPAKIIQDALQSVVRVSVGTTEGTGIVIAPDLILTNKHVVINSNTAKIEVLSGRGRTASLVKSDLRLDLALLQVVETFPREAVVDFSPSIQLGQSIFVIGNPKGVPFTVTDGIVSSRADRIFNDVSYFQISAPINHGNSGGPVINYDGDVVGIVTKKDLKYEGIAFALPASKIMSFIGPK